MIAQLILTNRENCSALEQVVKMTEQFCSTKYGGCSTEKKFCSAMEQNSKMVAWNCSMVEQFRKMAEQNCSVTYVCCSIKEQSATSI